MNLLVIYFCAIYFVGRLEHVLFLLLFIYEKSSISL